MMKKVIHLEGNSMYKESTIPMLSLRFDDGYADFITGYKPILDSFDIHVSVCILVAMLGIYGYMTWEQVKELYNFGHEIIAHGLTDVDVSILERKEAIDHIRGTKTIIQSHGIDCQNYVPHKAAAWHDFIRDIGRMFYSSVHCGGVDPVKGINPKIYDCYNMYAVCGDLGASWIANNSIGVDEVKKSLDIVKSENRWLIYYLHFYSEDKGRGLTEIINYALENSIKIVTINEGLCLSKNC